MLIFGGSGGGGGGGGEGLTIGRNFAFQNGLGLTIKQHKTLRKQPLLKQLKRLTLTVHGLEGGMRFGGLIFFCLFVCLFFVVVVFFFEGGSLLSEFYGILCAI